MVDVRVVDRRRFLCQKFHQLVEALSPRVAVTSPTLFVRSDNEVEQVRKVASHRVRRADSLLNFIGNFLVLEKETIFLRCFVDSIKSLFMVHNKAC